ncbi:replication protein [Paenibacillus polymyxa]|uniref:replication protein n=1 Tax=Paenibacillus polymyxa TaxID=1406 RepID=UPI0004B509CC|nr:replication protein [Paenibacillus polymyxa]
MVSPQLEKGFIGIANDIWDEIISRKFTERQQKILKLILRLSYGCQKKSAIIPLLTHFELCGVRIQDAKKEITYLKECKVIEWNEKQLYALNKNYDEWRVSLVKEWNKDRFKELISLNLSMNKVTKSVSEQAGDRVESYENCKSGVTKSVNGDLRKVEVKEGGNPCGSKDEGTPKDMFKNNIKDSSCCLTPENEFNSKDEGIPSSRQGTVPATSETDTDSEQNEISSSDIDYRQAVADKYLRRRGKGLEITIADDQAIDELIKEGVPLQTALDGIDQAFDNFKPKHKRDEIRSVSYCATIIFSLHALREVDSKSKEDETPLDEVEPELEVPTSEYTQVDIQNMLAKLRAKQGG